MTASMSPDRLSALLPGATLRETHASWVLVGEHEVLKVKKPVVLPFLDYGTKERRHAACRAEVALNRRLAPDVYRGVVAIVPGREGLALGGVDDPRAVDYAVRMRRYDECDTLAARIAAGTVGEDELERVGAHLARFHRDAEPATAGAEPLKRWIDDNHASLLALLDAADGRELVLASERFFAAFLGARWEDLDARSAAGRVRDGHGDLRAEHVLLEGDRIIVVDCVEFEPALRRIDVGCDLAFLVMDLMAAERDDLADALTQGYRAAGGDPGDDALVWALASYRAQVRAKVALLRAAEQEDHARALSTAAANRMLRLGEALAWRARGPLTVAVCGLSATGKTTLAGALARRSRLPHLSSDVVRKTRAGLPVQARGPVALYTAARNEEVYTELGTLAVAADTGAVVDATFRLRADRDAFAQAHGGVRPVVHVECVAPDGVRLSRAAARAHGPAQASDAGSDVAAAQTMEPLDEVAPEDHVIVRGDAPLEAQLAVVADGLDRRLA